MTSSLPPEFLARPIAHRALHDAAEGRAENSLAAVEAAVAHAYGIEIDVQMSADGEAMVFHDYELDRLTQETGPVRSRTALELQSISLECGGGTIPLLEDVLELINGRFALLIEIKDQDGALGPDVGPLEQSVAKAIRSYEGPVAVMSFNPHSVAEVQRVAPDVPIGLTTDSFSKADWALPEARREELRGIQDFARVGASFISHNCRDLKAPAVVSLREKGVPVLCWTVRTPEEEVTARRFADNVTFEGYLPA